MTYEHILGGIHTTRLKKSCGINKQFRREISEGILGEIREVPLGGILEVFLGGLPGKI